MTRHKRSFSDSLKSLFPGNKREEDPSRERKQSFRDMFSRSEKPKDTKEEPANFLHIDNISAPKKLRKSRSFQLPSKYTPSTPLPRPDKPTYKGGKPLPRDIPIRKISATDFQYEAIVPPGIPNAFKDNSTVNHVFERKQKAQNALVEAERRRKLDTQSHAPQPQPSRPRKEEWIRGIVHPEFAAGMQPITKPSSQKSNPHLGPRPPPRQSIPQSEDAVSWYRESGVVDPLVNVPSDQPKAELTRTRPNPPNTWNSYRNPRRHPAHPSNVSVGPSMGTTQADPARSIYSRPIGHHSNIYSKPTCDRTREECNVECARIAAEAERIRRERHKDGIVYIPDGYHNRTCRGSRCRQTRNQCDIEDARRTAENKLIKQAQNTGDKNTSLPTKIGVSIKKEVDHTGNGAQDKASASWYTPYRGLSPLSSRGPRAFGCSNGLRPHEIPSEFSSLNKHSQSALSTPCVQPDIRARSTSHDPIQRPAAIVSQRQKHSKNSVTPAETTQPARYEKSGLRNEIDYNRSLPPLPLFATPQSHSRRRDPPSREAQTPIRPTSIESAWSTNTEQRNLVHTIRAALTNPNFLRKSSRPESEFAYGKLFADSDSDSSSCYDEEPEFKDKSHFLNKARYDMPITQNAAAAYAVRVANPTEDRPGSIHGQTGIIPQREGVASHPHAHSPTTRATGTDVHRSPSDTRTISRRR